MRTCRALVVGVRVRVGCWQSVFMSVGWGGLGAVGRRFGFLMAGRVKGSSGLCGHREFFAASLFGLAVDGQFWTVVVGVSVVGWVSWFDVCCGQFLLGDGARGTVFLWYRFVRYVVAVALGGVVCGFIGVGCCPGLGVGDFFLAVAFYP